MRRALQELVLEGVETSVALHARLIDDEEFRRGDVDIHWLERRLPILTAPRADPELTAVAAIAGALLAARGAPRRSGQQVAIPADAHSPRSDNGTAWRLAARRDALRGA